MDARPFIGVGVVVMRRTQVLLGKRISGHGGGTWCFPGGHLEFSESVEDCAKREVWEETGLSLSGTTLGPFTNDFFELDGKHYVTLHVFAKCDSGEPRVMEPDKFEQWAWFSWGALPQPLFLPIVHLLERCKRGKLLP